MAHFYGNLKGSHSEATRCGTRHSGIRVSARSWKGSVTIELEETDSGVWAKIRCLDGSGIGGKMLYSGPIASICTASKLVPIPEA